MPRSPPFRKRKIKNVHVQKEKKINDFFRTSHAGAQHSVNFSSFSYAIFKNISRTTDISHFVDGGPVFETDAITHAGIRTQYLRFGRPLLELPISRAKEIDWITKMLCFGLEVKISTSF